MDEQLALAEPDPSLREAFLDLLADFARAGEDRHQHFREAAEADFPAFVEHLRHPESDLLHPEDAPEHVFWLVREGREIIGTTRIRPDLPDHRQRRIGHVGFDIRPSERGKGYGTRLVALVLERAKAMGLERVCIVCARRNAASARVIQNNGGRLVAEFVPEGSTTVCQQYCIDIHPRPEAP